MYAENKPDKLQNAAAVDKLLEKMRRCWLSDFSQARQYAEEALELASRDNDVIRMAKALDGQAVCNWNIGEYETAIKHSLGALRLLETDDSEEMQKARQSVYGNIGLSYYQTEDYERAIRYYLRSLDLVLRYGPVSHLYALLSNIGGVYWARENDFIDLLRDAIDEVFSKELVYGEHMTPEMRSITERLLRQDLGDDITHVFIEIYQSCIEADIIGVQNKPNLLLNIGLLHAQKKRNVQALDKMRESLECARQNKLLLLQPLIYVNIGLTLQNMERHEEAMINFEAGLKVSEEQQETHHRLNILNKMAISLEALGDLKGALDAKRKAYKLFGEHVNQEKNRQIAQLQLRYESEQRQRERELAEKKAEIYRLRNVELEQMVRQRTQRLLHMEKFYEVGKFAASIVHNLNGPLTTLLGALEVIDLHEQEAPDELRIFFDMLQSSADNMKQMIRSITRNVRSSVQQNDSPLDINHTLQTAIDFRRFDSHLSADLEIVTDFDEELPDIVGQEVHFLQIFDNLLRNAIDAMHSNPRKLLAVSTKQRDNGVIIRFSDTGSGIEPSHMTRIFDIDFTTKEVGKGTGLGLSITRQMVESYRGTIEVESELNEGTTFTIWLPVEVKGPQETPQAT